MSNYHILADGRYAWSYRISVDGRPVREYPPPPARMDVVIEQLSAITEESLISGLREVVGTLMLSQDQYEIKEFRIDHKSFKGVLIEAILVAQLTDEQKMVIKLGDPTADLLRRTCLSDDDDV